MRDDAADWADEVPKYRHRCPSYLQDHCRKCSYYEESDEAPINDDEGESDE